MENNVVYCFLDKTSVIRYCIVFIIGIIMFKSNLSLILLPENISASIFFLTVGRRNVVNCAY